mmetsp:Transcript_61408/g.68767  ORF Transcript_61408/g.68767 Transcript_61408/m.68767 type:complete len:247 (+) Transcript_61408:3547-4287(+)
MLIKLIQAICILIPLKLIHLVIDTYQTCIYFCEFTSPSLTLSSLRSDSRKILLSFPETIIRSTSRAVSLFWAMDGSSRSFLLALLLFSSSSVPRFLFRKPRIGLSSSSLSSRDPSSNAPTRRSTLTCKIFLSSAFIISKHQPLLITKSPTWGISPEHMHKKPDRVANTFRASSSSKFRSRIVSQSPRSASPRIMKLPSSCRVIESSEKSYSSSSSSSYISPTTSSTISSKDTSPSVPPYSSTTIAI